VIRWLALWVLMAAAVYVVGCATVRSRERAEPPCRDRVSWPVGCALERMCEEAGVRM
jgi:uncharacterized protein YceK